MNSPQKRKIESITTLTILRFHPDKVKVLSTISAQTLIVLQFSLEK